MNIVFTYLKAHLAKDTTAAVDLADYHPSVKNLAFARKILDLKLTNTEMKLKKCSGKDLTEQNKFNKYTLLSNKLKEIKKEKSCELNSRLNINEKRYLFKRIRDFKYINDPRNKDLSNKFLMRGYFKNRDLRMFYFKNANENIKSVAEERVNFSGSNLMGVDLSSARLEGSEFINSNLSETKININKADFTNANLDNATIDSHPSFRSKMTIAEDLDENFSGNTIFHTIKTIDDRYNKIKIKLMKNIKEEIECEINKKSECKIDIDSFPLDSIVNNITSKKYYMEDKELNKFAKFLLDSNNVKEKEKIFSKRLSPECLSFCLDLFLDYPKKEQMNDFMIKDNKAFIKLIAISVYHDDASIKEKARMLYNKYFHSDEVQSYINKTVFDNDRPVLNWDEKDKFNYILINDDKAMVINHKNLTTMLFTGDIESEMPWLNFSLYIDNKKKSVNESECHSIFNNDFTIFKDSYNRFINKHRIDKILSLYNLGDYYNRFFFTSMGEPMIYEERIYKNRNDVNLVPIFNELLIIPTKDNEETSLKDEHYQKICKHFELTSLSNEEKSRYLLSLVDIFIYYSFNFVPGSVEGSRKILKLYAYALMNKARELNPNLITNKNQLDEWTSLLLDKKYLDTYSTTEQSLFSDINKYGKEHFGDAFSSIIPLHWN